MWVMIVVQCFRPKKYEHFPQFCCCSCCYFCCFGGRESCCCRCSLWEAGGWYIKTGCLTKRFEYFLISIVRILTSNVSYVNYRFDARGAERGVDPYAVSLEAFKDQGQDPRIPPAIKHGETQPDPTLATPAPKTASTPHAKRIAVPRYLFQTMNSQRVLKENTGF